MKLNIWSREQAKPQANSSMNTASQVNEHVAEEGWVLVSTSHPKKTTPLKEDGPLFGDTWTFAGKSYKAPDFCVPQPLQAAFKPSKSSEAATKPWAYDHSKFNIRGEMVDRHGDRRMAPKKGIIGMSHADVASVTSRYTDHRHTFSIELSNAQEGKIPATQEEFLKAVWAAKMATMGVSWDA